MIKFEGMAFLILLTYTLALHFGGLEAYIFEAPRSNWFNMNREGICSFAGYYSLFLLAAALGNELLSTGRDSAKVTTDVLKRVGAYFVASTTMLAVLVLGYDLQVSRRLVSICSGNIRDTH
jgi:phosphatidylinositol glycan class W